MRVSVFVVCTSRAASAAIARSPCARTRAEPRSVATAGGREKCITLHVDLVDSHGELVRGRPVPVQVRLSRASAVT